MKTMVSIMGTVLLIGSIALAQTSTNGNSGKSKSSSKHGSQPQAGNSGFDDTTQPSNTPGGNETPAQSGSSPSSENPIAGSAETSSNNSASTHAVAQSGAAEAGQISNGPVAETVSDSSALIGWSTRDVARSTGVKYGASRANLAQTADAGDGADGKNHHARLQGLSPNTRYYFQVMENGQPVGGVGTFRTTAPGETPIQSKAIIPDK